MDKIAKYAKNPTKKCKNTLVSLLSHQRTVEGFHTKGWTKIFLVIFRNFFGQNSVLKGPEWVHTKNFIKIRKSKI
jgi:hypothetical protein